MKRNFRILIPIFITAVFIFLRTDHLEKSFNFGTDQGGGMLETYRMVATRKFTLIGATGSSWTFGGRYIFFSSLPYFIIMPVLLFSRWNPIPVSYLFILFQLVSLWTAYYVLSFLLKKPYEAVIFGVIYTCLPLMVEHSRFFWSPNLLLPISTFLLVLLLTVKNLKKRTFPYYFAAGILTGAGFQIHFSFILAIAIAAGFLIYAKKTGIKESLYMAAGFLLAMSPLIIFELRHNFYNIRTILFILSQTKKSGGGGVFRYNYHYLFPAVPFIIYIISVIGDKIRKINRTVLYGGLSLFTAYSFWVFLPVPGHGYTMVTGWNYPGLTKTESLILDEKPVNYNIVDLLTGDSRAMALRFLLTSAGRPPLTETAYPQTETLFIYSRVPVGEILSGSMWEIDSVRPLKLVKTEPVQNGIFLYELKRQRVVY